MDIEKLNFMSNERKIRMIIYCLNLFFMSIIIASDLDYFYQKENDIFQLDHFWVNVVQAGYFMLGFICLFVMVSLILSVFVSAWLIDNDGFKRFCGLMIVICAAMILFGADLIDGVAPYNAVLSLIPMMMIAYDLQCLK